MCEEEIVYAYAWENFHLHVLQHPQPMPDYALHKIWSEFLKFLMG